MYTEVGGIMSDESESSLSVTRKISLTKKANCIFLVISVKTDLHSMPLSPECPPPNGLGCERLTEGREQPLPKIDKVTIAD